MKSRKSAGKGVTKGGPSGLLISLLAHAGAFFLAGLLVVFTVQHKQEKTFEAPQPTERPKMKLKKPKVQLKKSAKPKSSSRIVTKVTRANMPEIKLPEMSGIGDGFAGGMGGSGFEMSVDLGAVTMFGSSTSIGNDLEGTLYDLKQKRNGGPSGIYENDSIQIAVEKFLRSGWRSSALSQYYRAPSKLYTPMIVVPPTDSALGTWAFGEREMGPWAYLLHYKGQLVHPDGIKFRFVTMGDNYLVIRVNGKVVMDYKNQFASAVASPPSKPLNYHLGHWWAYGSEWIELEPGVPQDVEFLLGDYKGYLFAAMVAVEEYGVDYPKAPLPMDNPKLPIFRTARLSPDQSDAIIGEMWEDHLDLTGGPIFNDYDNGDPSTNATETASGDEPDPELVAPPPETSPVRVWTMTDGKTVEGEYVNIMGGMVVLKVGRGKTLKVAPAELSEEDQLHVKLLNPPKLKLSFKKDTRQFEVKSNPDLNNPVPMASEFAGGVVIEQVDRRANYTRPLRMEFFVVLDEYDGDNFILHDRQIEEFNLTAENNRRFELFGRKDVMLRYEHYAGKVRGAKYKGYMILVFNERNEIIAQSMTHDWFLDIREELLTFPIGRHFNKEGQRVRPPSPPFTDQYWDAEP